MQAVIPDYNAPNADHSYGTLTHRCVEEALNSDNNIIADRAVVVERIVHVSTPTSTR